MVARWEKELKWLILKEKNLALSATEKARYSSLIKKNKKIVDSHFEKNFLLGGCLTNDLLNRTIDLASNFIRPPGIKEYDKNDHKMGERTWLNKFKEDGDLIGIYLQLFDTHIPENIAIACFPSSRKNEWGSMGALSKLLSGRQNRFDATKLIQRIVDVPSQRESGRGDIEKQIRSLRLDPKYLDYSKTYWVIDDCVTSGTSLNSAAAVLEVSGLTSVNLLALGDTVSSDMQLHEPVSEAFIKSKIDEA